VYFCIELLEDLAELLDEATEELPDLAELLDGATEELLEDLAELLDSFEPSDEELLGTTSATFPCSSALCTAASNSSIAAWYWSRVFSTSAS